MIFQWNVDPILLHLGPLQLRYYGLLFASTFAIAIFYMRWIYRREGKPEAAVESLLMAMILGTAIGARLGHCLFYEPEIYLRDPLRILKVWEGGLASHGAAIGIVVATYFYARANKGFTFLRTLDWIAQSVALSCGLIRLGNLFNSEILGKPTSGDWGVVFARVDQIPRHPAQLYESALYFLTFFLLRYLYLKVAPKKGEGFLIGVFFIVAFAFRFIVEFFKENQSAFESQLPLNMGQLLSVPVILIGVFLVFRAGRSVVSDSFKKR